MIRDLHSFFFFFLYKNIVFPAQAKNSYFFADFRLKIFLINILSYSLCSGGGAK